LPGLPKNAAIRTVHPEWFATKDLIKEYNVGAGDEILMLGRFISREGIQQNTPTARFGHISQMPGEPMVTDTGDMQDEAFLCEVRSIGGYSGSPVFMVSRRGMNNREMLLGVDFCHVPNWTNAYDDNGHALPHIRVPLNSGMAGVIPSWRLMEMLMSDDEVTERRKAEARELKRRSEPKAIADSSTSPVVVSLATNENPNHREDFTSLVGAAARKQTQGG
jgi:hypothetical protein